MQLQDTTFTFRLDKEIKDKFIETVKKNGTYSSLVLRQLMARYIRENSDAR